MGDKIGLKNDSILKNYYYFVAIMSKGRLQCVGSSLRLKQRFGAGYRITIGAKNDIEVLENIKLFFENNLPSLKFTAIILINYSLRC